MFCSLQRIRLASNCNLLILTELNGGARWGISLGIPMRRCFSPELYAEPNPRTAELRVQWVHHGSSLLETAQVIANGLPTHPGAKHKGWCI